MATRTVYLAITVKVTDEADAFGIAEGASAHLLCTFNDDASLLRVKAHDFAHCIVPATMLQALVDGAEFGQDQKDYDASRLEDADGTSGDTRDLRKTARGWRAAVRKALSILRTLPRRTAAPSLQRQAPAKARA
jgi:hypothetical protein